MLQTVWTEIARSDVYKSGPENVVYEASLTEEERSLWTRPTEFMFVMVTGPVIKGVGYDIIEYDCGCNKLRSLSYSDSGHFDEHLTNLRLSEWQTPVKGTVGEILYKRACKRK